MIKFIRQPAVFIPFTFVLVLVLMHLLNPSGCYGIVPRYQIGLRGILLAPLFHSDWEHLTNNAVPLLVLGYLVITFYKSIAYILFTVGWFVTHFLVWLFADMGWLESDTHIGCHIGASGLVYLLAFFLFVSGVLRKSVPLIAVSLVVIFLYGGMLWGIFPQELINLGEKHENMSWESHLFGALTGAIMAFIFKSSGPQRRKWAWQKEDYDHTVDEELWERYLERFPEEQQPIKEEKRKFKDLF